MTNLTPTPLLSIADQLHEAAYALYIRCDGAEAADGAGFNKPDWPLGHYLAVASPTQWDDGMVLAGFRMLEKYKKQLDSYGIAYDQIPAPPADLNPVIGEKRFLDFANGRFVAWFDYNYHVKEKVKAVCQVDPLSQSFDPAHKCWYISPRAHREMELGLVTELGFKLSRAALGAMDNIHQIIEGMDSEVEEHAPPKTAVLFDGTLFQFFFDKNQGNVKTAVKGLPGRKFVSGNDPHWTAPHAAGPHVEKILTLFTAVGEGVLEAIESAPPERLLDFDGSSFVAIFLYDRQVHYAVKDIPDRRFGDNPEPHWTLPLTQKEAVAQLALDYDFTLTEDAKSVLESGNDLLSLSGAVATDPIAIPTLAGALRPFQHVAVRYAEKAQRFFIGDEMGCGKTIEALASLERMDSFPALIIVPASLKLNWQKEAQKWLPHRTVRVNDTQTAVAPADIQIINYDILADGEDEDGALVLKQVALDLIELGYKAVVMDESHYIKNGKAQRSRACLLLAQKCDVRILLSGTLVKNRPFELVHQLKTLGRLNEFGGFWGFAKSYCNAQRTSFGWDFDGAANVDELNKILRSTCMVRRTKAQVLKDLPEKQRTNVYLDIDNRSEYQEAQANLIQWLKETAGDKKAKAAGKAEHLVRISALKQLAAQGKMKAVIEWVTNFIAEEKLILFGYHKEVVKQLAAHFDAPVIDGSTSVNDRQAAVERFQNDDDCRLIVGNIEAMGVGLTLTAASNVAFVELDWTPAQHDQAEDRAHRIGQENAVMAWYLLAAQTIDEQIMALIDHKRPLVQAVLDGNADAADLSILDDLIKALLEQ